MKGDGAIDRGAEKLDALADRAAEKGGIAGKASAELADDAAFLRKLKPSLIVARARGRLPKDAEPGTTRVAPSGPQLGPRSAAKKKRGPSPFAVAGAAFGIGTLVAKIVDWRGHAHPRR